MTNQIRSRAAELLKKYQDTFSDIHGIVSLRELSRSENLDGKTTLEDHEALLKIVQRWELHKCLRHVYIDYSEERPITIEGILTKEFPISNCRTSIETQVRFTVDTEVMTNYRLNKNDDHCVLDNLRTEMRIGVLYLFLEKEQVTLIAIPDDMKFRAEFE
jgi:hypothetical protein